MIKAILFDLDGVLIQTEHETFDFYKKYLEKKGVILKASDFKYKAGRKSAAFWNDVLTPKQQKEINTKKLVNLKRDLFNKYPDKYIKKISGGKEILIALKRAGYKIALVSQNESRMINSVIEWLGIRKYFDVILSIDNIKKLKPDPEIYLLAAKKLNIKPSESLVIEDSRDGVNSAKNAKMKCIGIKHEYTPRGSLSRADIVVRKLGNINLSLIESL